MVKMLSLTVDEMTDGALTPVEFDRARLDRARAGLDAIDVVGFQEDFDGFCAELWPAASGGTSATRCS